MKKLITLLTIILMASPALAIDSVEESTAKVKIGPVSFKVKNSKDTGNVSISRSGDSTVTFGCTYSKVVIKGINTRSTTGVVVLQFDSLEGEFEAGQTYDLSNSDPSALTTIALATKTAGAKVRGVSTGDDAMGGEIPVATGKFKVIKYDAQTQEITGNLIVKVSPIVTLKGTKSKFTTKAQTIKMKINTIVQ